MKENINYLNNKIYAYNMQSAVMNGTMAGLNEVTENTSDLEIAYIQGRLDEHFGFDEEVEE